MFIKVKSIISLISQNIYADIKKKNLSLNVYGYNLKETKYMISEITTKWKDTTKLQKYIYIVDNIETSFNKFTV